jgi:hypothetical protein
VDFLRAAAPGYCTSQQRAEAPENWFERALAYATGKLHGAAAPLSPAGAGMSRVAGYTPADYVLQHASRELRYTRVPASTWEAIISYIRDPADAARIAGSAKNRLLYRYAIPLYRHAAEVGDGDAVRGLANLLAKRGDLDEATQILRARAEAGDETVVFWLATLLAEAGDLEEAIRILRARADADDQVAAMILTALLIKYGGEDGEAAAKAYARDWTAARLQAAESNPDELLARLDADGGFTAWQLAMDHAERGDPEEAIRILWARADAGDKAAATRLATELAERGDLEGLRARADVDDAYAGMLLAKELAERGDLEELRARADAGDKAAASRLADLLAERGDLEELRARADAGDGEAAKRLPEVLIKQGRGEEAERLRRFGLNPDGSIAGALASGFRQ